MDTYLVCYDISDPKRLRKVAQTCEDFGVRRQFSVFLCRLTATDLEVAIRFSDNQVQIEQAGESLLPAVFRRCLIPSTRFPCTRTPSARKSRAWRFGHGYLLRQ